MHVYCHHLQTEDCALLKKRRDVLHHCHEAGLCVQHVLVKVREHVCVCQHWAEHIVAHHKHIWCSHHQCVCVLFVCLFLVDNKMQQTLL